VTVFTDTFTSGEDGKKAAEKEMLKWVDFSTLLRAMTCFTAVYIRRCHLEWVKKNFLNFSLFSECENASDDTNLARSYDFAPREKVEKSLMVLVSSLLQLPKRSYNSLTSISKGESTFSTSLFVDSFNYPVFASCATFDRTLCARLLLLLLPSFTARPFILLLYFILAWEELELPIKTP